MLSCKTDSTWSFHTVVKAAPCSFPKKKQFGNSWIVYLKNVIMYNAVIPFRWVSKFFENRDEMINGREDKRKDWNKLPKKSFLVFYSIENVQERKQYIIDT